MRFHLPLNVTMLSLVAISMIWLTGCGSTATTESDSQVKPSQASEKSDTHEHSGWWCVEHGVPEHECGLCDSKVAAACKKRGDWCEKHHRPNSQCFVCQPELAAKFAARYEAKFGKKPAALEPEEE